MQKCKLDKKYTLINWSWWQKLLGPVHMQCRAVKQLFCALWFYCKTILHICWSIVHVSAISSRSIFNICCTEIQLVFSRLGILQSTFSSWLAIFLLHTEIEKINVHSIYIYKNSSSTNLIFCLFSYPNRKMNPSVQQCLLGIALMLSA